MSARRQEAQRRDRLVLDFLRRNGPARSQSIVAGTGMSRSLVYTALVRLRRDGAVILPGDGCDGPLSFWRLTDRSGAAARAPKPVSGITKEDLEWQRYWKDRARQRRALAARGAGW